MPTAMREDSCSATAEPWTTVLGKLSAVAVILTPLVAMLFPELNQRSENTPSKNRPVASSTRSISADASLNPFSVKRIDP
jgi:hypothetical protein